MDLVAVGGVAEKDAKERMRWRKMMCCGSP